MTKSGEIPHIRLRRNVRYSVKDLERWIESQRREGRPNDTGEATSMIPS